MYEGVSHTEAHLFKKSAIVPRLQNIMLFQDLAVQTSETCVLTYYLVIQVSKTNDP